jgi:uncharacterized RDD family membrane protein YckC
VDLDDRITVATPEGLELQLQLAGLGSRFIAGVTDVIIQVVLVGILALVVGLSHASGGLGIAVFVIGTFLIVFFYPVFFEVWARGATPGKRACHLRVIRDCGAPVDLPASAIRNIVRLLDGPLLLYVPTIIWIAVTRRHQRPGDIAAGTLVVREQAPARKPRRGRRQDPPRPSTSQAPSDWDASAVTAQEIAAVRRFLERRDSLAAQPRAELARRLAEGLRTKVTAAPQHLSPERFLEELERIKRTR